MGLAGRPRACTMAAAGEEHGGMHLCRSGAQMVRASNVLAAVLLLGSVGAPSPAPGAQKTPEFGAGVSVVALPLFVTGKDGRRWAVSPPTPSRYRTKASESPSSASRR